MNNILKGFRKKFQKVYKKLTKIEKLILIFCCMALVVGVVGLMVNTIQAQKSDQGIFRGGVYTEGVLFDNSALLEKNIITLTKSGLLRLDENLALLPSIATDWKVDQTGKEYSFTISEKVNSQQVVDSLKTYKNDFSGLNIEARDNQVIIKSEKPLGSLLYNLTEPMIDFGPYKIQSQDSAKVVLVANSNWIFGEPYISKIVLKFYQNEDRLINGLANGEIQGAGNILFGGEKYNHYSLELNKNLSLFFNLSLPKLQDIALRKTLRDGGNYQKGADLILTTVDQQMYIQEAEAIQARAEKQNIKIGLEYLALETVRDVIIKNRDYELLLFGLEMGRDPDLYPYYHSSQIDYPGQNLSQMFDLGIDKILDEARRETDPTKRKEQSQLAQQEIDKKIPSFTVKKLLYDYTLSKEIQNVKVGRGINEADRFGNVWEWQINKSKIK
ncbi:MAG: putative Extracellular solute-binding protein family 5 [Candidatus Berkelbacteria bacterium Licking1014_7]|uniref:Putative Extracellular solute-binding protein family 5 n=1 Tax=Candidatus Berkelbacteria bacterium Licking1014_7 TaxID=2017147 RepID=A0A554LHY1_9BACT|nr:MAG: putative Extracellular solute-binding protein family 5 [Candidatus Berkelbacteria bacterium Licking1014_7]